MIAVVLLIALTVAIGGILSVWFSTMVKTPIGGAEASQEKLLACGGVSLDIEEVRQDVTNKVNDTIRFFNPSKAEIVNLTLYADGFSMALPNDFSKIGPNEIKKFSWNITSTFSFVRITGFCLGEIGVKGECEPGMRCWVS